MIGGDARRFHRSSLWWTGGRDDDGRRMDASSEICSGAWALAVGGMTREMNCETLDMFIAFSLRMLQSRLALQANFTFFLHES